MYISIWYVEQSVFSAMQMSDRIPNVVCSHQHDHHMNKHIVRVVPCPECINRGGGTLIGAVYLCGLVQPCI